MKINRLSKILLRSLTLFFILSTSIIHAGGTLELDAALSEAIANNPELKALKETVKAKEVRARAERALEDPTFKVEMEDLSKDRPLKVSPNDAMLTRYTLSQGLPFPGKLPLKEKMALKEALAQRSRLASRELEIKALVKESFFDYAYLAASIKITEEIKELLSRMARIASSRYSTGQASQQDVIKINLEAAMLNNDIITLGAEKELSAARLKSLLYRTQDSSLGEPAELAKERVELDTAELIGAALKNNPEIKTSEFEADASALGVDLAKKGYYPDFMVGVAPIQRDNKFDSFDLMFQVNIPIWRDKYDSLEKEASSNLEAARFRVIAGKNRKALEVKEASLMVEAADRIRSLYETSLLPQANLSFDAALKNYQAGKTDFLMLLDAGRQLKRVRLEHLRSILDYRKRVAALERATGVELKPTVKEDAR